MTIKKINLSRIFYDLLVKVGLPNTSSHFDTPTMIYTLLTPIGFKTIIFNEFISNVDAKAFLDDNCTLSCDCAGSPFVDKHHNHIIMGNLKIIETNKLRKLLSKVQNIVNLESLTIKKLRIA